MSGVAGVSGVHTAKRCKVTQSHTCNIKLLTIEEYKVFKVLTMKIFQTQ